MGAGLEKPTQTVYEVQNGEAMALKAAAQADGGLGTVKLIASPVKSTKQVLIVQGSPTAVDSALEILRNLDTGRPRADMTTKMYEVKYLDPRSLREDLVFQFPGLSAVLPPNSAGNPRLYQPGLAGTTRTTVTEQPGGGVTPPTGTEGDKGAPATTTTGVKEDKGTAAGLVQPFQDFERSSVQMKLLLRGPKELIDQALDYLAIIDVAPKQVALELRVMELSKEEALSFGIDWNILTGGAVNAIRLNQSHPDASTNKVAASLTGAGWSGDVTAILDKISNKDNLISRPNVLAIDGRETELFVGDIIRYIKQIQSSQNGTTVTVGEEPVGVRLAVLPRVGGDNNLTLDLRPVVSFLKDWTNVPGGGRIPNSSVRVAQSTVNINSGETIAIGGLIQDQDVYNVSKVPLLGDLPVLGELFRRTTKSKRRTEIVFFLTAKVVDNTDRAKAASTREWLKKVPDPAKFYEKTGSETEPKK
jgi:type II secretory pathway component GspD/PulD (secretin)